MRTWQVFAGIVVLALLAITARLLRESRKPSQILFVVLLVPIPAAGFGLYVLDPGPLPTFTVITLVALVLLTLAVWPAFYAFLRTERSQTRRTWTIKDFNTLNRYVLARRACGLLGVSGFLFLFNPWFAYANLAVILAWVAIWIPPGRRVMRLEVTGKVSAAANTTFRFIVEPSNLSRYSDSVVVSVNPDGPMAVGTELTTHRTMQPTGSDHSGADWLLVEHSKVQALSGTSITTVSLDRQAIRTTDVRSSGSAAVVTQRSEWTVTFTDSILGLWLDQRGEIGAADKEARLRFDRLSELIGGPTPAS